jgi:hypothetical protein
MAKPITELTKDIRKLVEDGRAAAGPQIIFSLQKAGPWWTGNFGEQWKLGAQPIKATVERTKDWTELPSGKKPPRPDFSPTPALKVSIDSPLYIGNAAKYAGYAVNDSGAKIGGQTYGEARPPKITTAPSGVRWYEVYTVTNRDTGLFLDLDKAFASVRLG